VVTQLTKLTVTTNSDTTIHIERALNTINDITKEQSGTIEKANIAIEKLQEQTVRIKQ